MQKEANHIRIAGVIGDPINHTRSPLIHYYWIKKIVQTQFKCPSQKRKNEKPY